MIQLEKKTKKKKVTKWAIKANQIYKRKAKLEKIASDLQVKLNKRCASERLKYDKLKEIQIANINIRYDKKLEKRLSKIAREYDNRKSEKRFKVYWKVIKTKLPTLSKMKNKALSEIQLYAKLIRAWTEMWLPTVYLVDKKAATHISQSVNWWHVYGQRNYPHMAFEIDNIRPISWFSNKMQGDQIAQWKVNLPEDIQDKLQAMSDNKSAKNELRNHTFYQNIIDKYKKLNEIEQKRLWIGKMSNKNI